MWTVLTALCLVLYWVTEQQKISPQYQCYPIPVNIAQYPITQYQYRSNPSGFVKECALCSISQCTFYDMQCDCSVYCFYRSAA